MSINKKPPLRGAQHNTMFSIRRTGHDPSRRHHTRPATLCIRAHRVHSRRHDHPTTRHSRRSRRPRRTRSARCRCLHRSG